MNELNRIINNNTFAENKLYLLSKPAEGYGFFYQDGTVYFGKESVNGTETESIDTLYLDLNMRVFMESEDESQSFQTGYYDLLSFKGSLDELYFDIFLSLCKTYCFDTKNISFYEFFNSIVKIFKINKADIYKQLIGLIGELLLIKYMYENHDINIADNWHLTGTNSKYDFSFSSSNLEVKTTTKSEAVFKLRHNQIFNNLNNYVCVVSLIETGTGESLNSLIEYFTSNPMFSTNVKFQIALVNEYVKIMSNSDKEKSFTLDALRYYSVKDMPTIEIIPSMISCIEYNYEFIDIDESSYDNIFDL